MLCPKIERYIRTLKTLHPNFENEKPVQKIFEHL